MILALLTLLLPASTAGPMKPEYFVPAHRVAGIGVARADLTAEMLAVRTDQMIESQTFGIMRDPQAATGAVRITGAKLKALFQSAARQSGFPAATLEAIAYLESWGDPKAESPAGPRGIMQISEATARRMGLKIVRVTRYKVTRELVPVARKGKKPVYRTVTRRKPYTVTLKDERLLPERAIPAAALYLAGLEQRYRGRDWAIFAYHCGEGCVADMLERTREARGIPHDDVTVARMFFAANPAWNRPLYEAIQRNLERDYSPTYWFRIRRAEQLLALYRTDPADFRRLWSDYRSQLSALPRAPHRLSVWLTRDDLTYRNYDDLRAAQGSRLMAALNRPDYFGYFLRKTIGAGDPLNQHYYWQASPSALGTLTYIAFETRRLHEALRPRGETFQPLQVTALVQPLDRNAAATPGELQAHSSGHVFDISFADLPAGERECLRFVLNDLGWQGYLGFVEEGPDNLHIGCSPSSRDFFTQVFQEAAASAQTSRGPAHSAKAPYQSTLMPSCTYRGQFDCRLLAVDLWKLPKYATA